MTILAELFERLKYLPPPARLVLSCCVGALVLSILYVSLVGLFEPASHASAPDRASTSTASPSVSPLLFGTNLPLRASQDTALSSTSTRNLLLQVHPTSIRLSIGTGLSQAELLQAAQLIKSLGAVPVISLPGSLDHNVLADDTQILKQMQNVFGTQTVYYEYGNEEDLLGVSANQYTASWNAIVPLLKVQAPHSQFVGPVTYQADPSYLKLFLQQAQPRPDAVSWHEYSCTQTDTQATCLAHLSNWSSDISTARRTMTAVMAKALPIMITQWNYAPNATSDDGKSSDSAFLSTWMQKAFQTLIANHVFAAMQDAFTGTPAALVSPQDTLTVQGAVFMAQAQRAGVRPTSSSTSTLVASSATATAQAQATPQAQATATAQAQNTASAATATAQAQDTASAASAASAGSAASAASAGSADAAATATAQAQDADAAATATAQAQDTAAAATATAQAQDTAAAATATAQAQDTAAQTPPQTPPSKPAPVVTSCPQISYGSTGSEVKILQERLNAQTGAGLVVDGNFGPYTQTAVENFQRAHIAQVKWVDGVVGPLTWAALGGCGSN